LRTSSTLIAARFTAFAKRNGPALRRSRSQYRRWRKLSPFRSGRGVLARELDGGGADVACILAASLGRVEPIEARLGGPLALEVVTHVDVQPPHALNLELDL